MKKKSFETFSIPSAAWRCCWSLSIAFNFITGAVKQRVDLTKEKAYTLSAGTKAILHKLDTPVKIRFYYSPAVKTASPDTVF